MNEAKVVNYLFASLLIVTIILFSWTCVYAGSMSVYEQSPTVVAAFNA